MHKSDKPGKPAAKNRYLRGAMGMTGLRVASVGLGLAVTVLLSRGLGPAEFGIFAFAISLATLLSLPLTGGLPTLMMREIAAAGAHENPALRAGVIRWGYRLLAGVSFGLWALLGLAWWAGHALDIWPWDARVTAVAGLVVLLVPVLSLQHVQRSIFAGHDRVVLGNLGEQLIRPALMTLLLLGLGALIWPMGSLGALSLQLVATVAAIGLSFVLMTRRLPHAPALAPEIRGREWLWALLPLTALSTTTIITNNTDVLMLGVMVEPAEIGIYRIAAQVALLATLVMQILRSLSAPRIAAAFAKDDRATMQRHFVRAGRAMFAAAAVFVLAFAAVGQPALRLVFGPEYVAAWGPCLVLALGALFSSACGLVGIVLQVTRHAGLAARSAVISAVVNVVLNLALIPLWGALGAAIATSISLVTMQAQQWWIARRVLGMRTDAFQRMTL